MGRLATPRVIGGGSPRRLRGGLGRRPRRAGQHGGGEVRPRHRLGPRTLVDVAIPGTMHDAEPTILGFTDGDSTLNRHPAARPAIQLQAASPKVNDRVVPDDPWKLQAKD